jgi:hypothetical protein
MRQFLEVLSLCAGAAALGFALAHAAELPGKLRLDCATYKAVQRTYYPGFTIGGASEPLAVAVVAALLWVTPRAAPPFGWTAAALGALGAMQLVYWRSPGERLLVARPRARRDGHAVLRRRRWRRGRGIGRRKMDSTAQPVGAMPRRARRAGRGRLHLPCHRADNSAPVGLTESRWARDRD